MKCEKCGMELMGSETICPGCGTVINEMNDTVNGEKDSIKENTSDNGGFVWGLLGFFIPLVGLILYLVWKNEKPKTAKAVGLGALISFIINIVFLIVSIILTTLTVAYL